ncbi:hypothetical protein [Rhizobium tubonense]|uniref:Uncharacterized protein n=1 Tax=Rhizobium tubonense TaxID=484088 RepID=A0A2W4D0Y9_9HYPH|nr:hypothetical protein [Rhizobium tubonense]PZM11184.1 hypothetical protein CPY51_20630 [Rhizobium tubonense]
MAIFIWSAIFAIVICFAFVATRIASQSKDEGLQDTGLAILEFGRAFPTEAIRQLQRTENGQAMFVRLHDNKAGFMKNLRNHFACHLIQPGRVRVRDAVNPKAITIDFLDAPHHNGTFEFSTPMDAAEVSLWLLGNYVATHDLEPPAITAANKA